MGRIVEGVFIVGILAMFSISAYAETKVVVIPLFEDEPRQSASDTFLSGGGTFISGTRLNSIVALNITNIDLGLLGTAQFPSGKVQLQTFTYDIDGDPPSTYQFRTGGIIDCVMLESYDAQTGDYELVFSYTNDSASEIEMLNALTFDAGPFTGTISSENDKSVGRLRRVNGWVTRSDWTTGYENCLGIGQPSLLLDNGVQIFEGSRTLAEFTSCSAFTPMPTCASFEPGGFNDGKLSAYRPLAGDIKFND